MYHLIYGDCLETMRGSLKQYCADAVVTDPPYGTGGHRRYKAGTGSNPRGRLTRESWDVWDTSWVSPLQRLLNPKGKAVVFCPVTRIGDLTAAMSEIDMPILTHVVWEKTDPKPPMPGRLGNAAEHVLIFGRGQLHTHGESNIWRGSAPRLGRDGEATGHPYEKPLALVRWLVGLVLPNDWQQGDQTVLDPFAGSGTTLVAAHQLGFHSIGIERDLKYWDMARKRMGSTPDPLFTREGTK